MWLSSACLGVLDGECRSSALAAGLGWTQPLGGSVLAQQLLQLGGRVESGGVQCGTAGGRLPPPPRHTHIPQGTRRLAGGRTEQHS